MKFNIVLPILISTLFGADFSRNDNKPFLFCASNNISNSELFDLVEIQKLENITQQMVNESWCGENFSWEFHNQYLALHKNTASRLKIAVADVKDESLDNIFVSSASYKSGQMSFQEHNEKLIILDSIVSSSRSSLEMWLTKSDQSVLLQKQPGTISFTNNSNGYSFINVDSSITYQSIDGFGFALTGGSAYVINQLNASDKSALLNELFGNGPNSIGVSYLRISIGASDLNESVYSYDDLPAGQTDTTLANFSLSQDTVDVIPLLKQILAINPNIKLLGSPWSPPVWMKDNGSSIGGSLLPQYYDVYAKYFVKYIQAMQAKGITVNAITIQNEPQYGGNNPSMVMSATQQADFIKNNMGPAFHNAGITTKIIVWDHNCDNPGYPISVLSDPAANPYIDGSAFHLYAGDISALSTVHTAFPDKNLYFTEQWTGANETFDGNLKWHIKNVIIGSVQNWSKVALEWNLASDANYQPHTPGGCSECKGAITVSGGYTRNVSYYIIGQVAKFVPPGSLRISSSQISGLSNVAFLRPDGKKVLLLLNEGNATNFNLKYKGRWATISMPASSVATFIW